MTVATAAAWVALIVITAVCFTLIYYLWSEKIDLRRLISEPNGDASMSRFQLLVFTLVVAFGLFIVTVSGEAPKFPENIPQSVLALLGISASSYLVSKGIQFSTPQGARHERTEDEEDEDEAEAEEPKRQERPKVELPKVPVQ